MAEENGYIENGHMENGDMEDGDVVEYPQTQATRFYACNRCHTHIALSPDCVFHREADYITFKNAVNVMTDNDPVQHIYTNFFTLAKTRCAGCSRLLGKEIVQVRFPIAIYQEYVGNIEISLRKLLFWNGNEMVAALRAQRRQG